MISEQRILLISNLNRRTSILDTISTKALFHSPPIQKHTCGIKTRSPTATPQLTLLPSLSRPPGPTASTFASFSSLTLLSGRKMPEAVLDSAFMRCTRTRSRRGARERIDFRAVVWEGVLAGVEEEERGWGRGKDEVEEDVLTNPSPMRIRGIVQEKRN
jgi:hypothetical protein